MKEFIKSGKYENRSLDRGARSPERSAWRSNCANKITPTKYRESNSRKESVFCIQIMTFTAERLPP